MYEKAIACVPNGYDEGQGDWAGGGGCPALPEDGIKVFQTCFMLFCGERRTNGCEIK